MKRLAGRIFAHTSRRRKSSSSAELDPALRDSKIERAHQKSLDIAQQRLVIGVAVFMAAFLMIAGRLFDVTLLRSDSEAASNTPLPTTSVATTGRANIVDRNGEILATSLATASLYVNPHEILDVNEAAQKLSKVFPELKKDDLRKKLSEKRSFVWIKRNLSPEMQYKVHMLGLPGFAFQREDRRIYPNGKITSHIVGYTDLDNKGIAGIEKTFDERLRKNNEPLVLSIDLRIQNILRDELRRAIKDFNAKGGAAMVMSAHSGELLGMVSYPDFDPHHLGAASNDAKFNRNTLGLYEMGSTFKVFNTAMALDTGRIGMGTSYDATKPMMVGNHMISDYHPQNRWLTVPEIFEHSSNIGSARMALDVGGAAQRKFLEKMGMFKQAAIELPEVGTPIVPARWSDATTITVSYGYGISVSPLHVVRAVASIVNDGVLVEPTLLKKNLNETPDGARVITSSTSEKMRSLLRLVVEKGTGQKAEAAGYFVGGKTGTAEKNSVGGYAQKALISSFVGAFPIQDPEYVVFVMVDEPQGTKQSYGFATAGWVAAPAVSRVVARMAPLLGLPPMLPKNNPNYGGQFVLQKPLNGADLASYKAAAGN